MLGANFRTGDSRRLNVTGGGRWPSSQLRYCYSSCSGSSTQAISEGEGPIGEDSNVLDNLLYFHVYILYT
jgi:hypothetical protein